MTSLVLIAVSIAAMYGWYTSLKRWQAALAREQFLLKLVHEMVTHRVELLHRMFDSDDAAYRQETRH